MGFTEAGILYDVEVGVEISSRLAVFSIDAVTPLKDDLVA